LLTFDTSKVRKENSVSSLFRKEREMTTRRKATGGKGKVKNLKLKKETVRDLDAKGKGKDIKGGMIATVAYTCYCGSIGLC